MKSNRFFKVPGSKQTASRNDGITNNTRIFEAKYKESCKFGKKSTLLSLISISKKNEKHIEKNRIKPKMSTLGDF
jgi:hypothetical protein